MVITWNQFEFLSKHYISNHQIDIISFEACNDFSDCNIETQNSNALHS